MLHRLLVNSQTGGHVQSHALCNPTGGDITVAQIVMAIVFAILLIPASMFYWYADAVLSTGPGYMQTLDIVQGVLGISYGWLWFWIYVTVCSFLVWLIGKAKNKSRLRAPEQPKRGKSWLGMKQKAPGNEFDLGKDSGWKQSRTKHLGKSGIKNHRTYVNLCNPQEQTGRCM